MANLKIYRDEAAGVVYFENSTVNPTPVNVCVATEVAGEVNRIKIVRTDKFIKGTNDFRILFKRLNFTRVRDENDNSFATRTDAINYLNSQFAQAAPVNVNASYLGVWDATNNNPDITSLTPTNGDWFYITETGSIDPNGDGVATGSDAFKIDDIIKYCSASTFVGWQHIPNETIRVEQLRDEVNDIVSGRFFRGYVPNAGEMNLLSGSNLQYIVREDTNTIWQYSGSSWNDTSVTASLGIISQLDENLQNTALTASALTFDTNMSLLNTNTSIYADGAAGEPDPNNESGWYFKNTGSPNKINWYFLANQNPNITFRYSDLKNVYAVIKNYNNNSNFPFFTIYTKPQGDGNDAAFWYRSRITFRNTNVLDGTAGTTFQYYLGEIPNVNTTIPQYEATIDSFSSQGPQSGSEEILFGAFSTDSSEAAEGYQFTVKSLGFRRNQYNTNFTLEAAGASQDVLTTIDGVQTTLYSSSLSSYDIYVDSNYTGSSQLGSTLRPYTTIQQAVDAAPTSEPIEILLNGNFLITSSVNITNNKQLHFKGTEGTKVKYASYNQSNGNIFTYSGTNYSGELVVKNIEFKNAGGFAISAVSASKIDIHNCIFENNGWSGTGISFVNEETGSILGYNSSTGSLQTFYSTQCSEGGAISISNSGIVEITDNTLNNNNKGIEVIDSGFIGTTEAFGFMARNQIYNNVSIGIDLESSTGNSLAGNRNFTVYNNAVNQNGDTGIKIEGGINNTLSLGIIKGNWNSGVELSHVANTRVRDLDLNNNNRAGVDAEGDESGGLASIQIEGGTIRDGATFITEIFNVQIHNTNLGSNTIKCGLLIREDVGNVIGSSAVIKLDNLGFIEQDYALDIEPDLDNLRLIIGDCEYIDTRIKTVRYQGTTGRYSELPFSNFTVDIPYLDFSIDRNSKTILLKDGQNGKVLNVYPINSIKSIIQGSRIDIIQTDSDKIQLRGLAEGRIYKDGNLISGSLNDVNNAINASFTETTPTALTPTTTLATISQSISTFETGSETGTSGSYFTGSDGGFNHGFVLTTDNALTSSGEFYTFTINTEGIIGMGFNKSGSTGIYTSESIGTGTGTAQNGYYWSTWFHPTPDGPWSYYGESSGDTTLLSGWYNFDDSDSGADWLNGVDVTMRAGIDNDGYPYLSYYSANAGGYVPIARDGNTITEGSVYNLLIKFGDENAKVSNVMLHHSRDLTAQDLTYYAIESPDGVWYYPMFLTAVEANWFDTNLAQPTGAGTSEGYNFIDDTSGNTYFIPASGSSTGSTVHPTGSYLSGSTFNYVITENDDLYAPSGFGNVTVTLNEGDSLNQQVIPAGYSDTRTLVNPPSWISLSGNNAVGTAPDVLLDNNTVPSASYSITVRSSNAYGTTDGTLTVKVLNTTTNVNLDGTIHQGTFLSEADYNNDYGTSHVTSVNRDAFIVTAPAGQNGAVYDLPNTLDDGDSYEWPFTAWINIGIVSESVDKTGTGIVSYFENSISFNDRFDLLFTNQLSSSTLYFSRDNNVNLEATGWDNNTFRVFPGGPHATTFNASNPKDMFKLYNNAGRIELSYDINDGNGYQLFASSSALHGTGSDAPTLTVALPVEYSVDNVPLPSFTYTANGASAPNGFTLVSGAMDTSLIAVSKSVASIDSIEIGAGERLVIPKEWAETNILPYISELGVVEHKILLGVSASNPTWNSIGQADFDNVIMWTNEGANYTRYRLYVTGSGAGTVNVNSDTDGYYDHAIEFTREGNLFIGRTPASSNNVETLLYDSNTWVNSGLINAWTASRGNENPITPIMGSDNSRMRLSTAGLSVQRAPLPTRQYDVVEDTFSLPLFKRYNETDVAFGGLTLNAGETYKFWLHDPSIESTDLLSFVSSSDSSSAITQGVTSSGTPGTFGSYLEFNVPSDVQPLKVAWTSGGTFTTGSVSIAGSTYVEGVTGITLEGPSGNQTGTNLFDNPSGGVKWGWLSIDEQLNAGQRFIMDNAFLVDLTNAMPNNSGIFIGLKNTSSWTSNLRNNSIANATVGGARFAIYRYSSSDIRIFGYVTGGTTIGRNYGTNGISNSGVELAIDLTNSGNNIRLLMMSGINSSDDVSTTPYADWSSTYKAQTGDQGYGISAIDIMMLGDGNINATGASGAMDSADVDWTALSEINVPATTSVTTTWTKALDFSGGSEYVTPVNTSATYNPLDMGGSSVTVSAPADSTKTTAASSGRPWATAIVFKTDGNATNQHIWNSGEGGNSTDDNIYLRVDANGTLYFGWGRSGAKNEVVIGTGFNTSTAINKWWGVYIAHNGTRLSGANATAANLADAFDIRIMHYSGGSWVFAGVGGAYADSSGNRSTSTNWGRSGSSIGGRMDRQYTGDLTIGGRSSNRNWHGKVASMVVTTLKLNVAMPGDAEIEMMITDPLKWLNDYKVGNSYRQSYFGTNNSNFQVTNSATDNAASFATQVWIMGDGTNDSYANGIRNQVNAGDQNYTKLNFNSMVSSDIETVSIAGLT